MLETCRNTLLSLWHGTSDGRVKAEHVSFSQRNALSLKQAFPLNCCINVVGCTANRSPTWGIHRYAARSALDELNVL